MTGSEKILQKIRDDAKAECDALIAAARADAKDTAREAEEQIKLMLQKAQADGRARAERQQKLSASSADLQYRSLLLKTRREQIDLTVDALKEYLVSLDDERYFAYLYRCAAQFAGAEGVVFLNQKDLGRLPDDFIQKMKEAGVTVTVSETPAAILGGFILRQGDVDLSADFEAMIYDRLDSLEDEINALLFAE